MSTSSPTTIQPGDIEATGIARMRQTAGLMSTWLRFLSVIYIFSGALTALTIIGIVVAWLPIWLGVLLFQAGDRAANAHQTGNPVALAELLDKLKMFFIISATTVIICLAFSISGLFLGGLIMEEMLRHLPIFLQYFN